jgi:hypothetical protein
VSLFTLATEPAPGGAPLPAYGRWLASWLWTLGSGFGTGAGLLELLPAGMNAGTAEADRLLEGAEAAEWIRSTGPCPSVSQRFFGVPSVRAEKALEHAPKNWHGFEPGARWQDAWKFVQAHGF